MAARNKAAFEWIHHEPVARRAGVTTEQLTRIGNVKSTSFTAPGPGQLSPVQAAVAQYADSVTAQVQVKETVFTQLKTELAKAANLDLEAQPVQQRLVEATGTAAVYNMVSRFLVALDVDDRADQPVPVPGDGGGDVTQHETEGNYPLPSSDPSAASRGLVQVQGGETLATRVHFHSMQAPWLVLINSLMTNLQMWDDVVPELSAAGYNVVCYDQRGHGGSSVPAQPCTVEQLADDCADVLTALGIAKAHAVIGVSQGGATALSFAIRHPDRADRIVANDTQAASPAANKQAWEDRIEIAHSEGMATLADATVNRWYGVNSSAGSDAIKARVHKMIASTNTKGFEQGARALQQYDLIGEGLLDALAAKHVLLVAGEGDGALPKGLEELSKKVGGARVHFKAIPNAAHLPMVDNPAKWLEAVLPFLKA